MAPHTANKSPRNAFPCMKLNRLGQTSLPELREHQSLIPTPSPPNNARISPIPTAKRMGSLIVNGESRATQSGIVLTNTTELATVGYCNEVIQVAKCNARKIPDKSARSKSGRLRDMSSRLWVDAATGTRMIEAKVNLQAAITSEEASFWAKRMKIEAVETAKMPNRMAIMGETGERLGECIRGG